jgi:hypothetical protein
MVMKVFRIGPAAGAPKVHSATCGEESVQTGIGVRPDAVKQGHVDTLEAKPLCDACLRLLQAEETR